MALFCLNCYGANKEPESPAPKKLEIDEHSTIVCFGDSITFGKGAENPEESYPAFLQQKVNIPVINAGVNDNTTTDGLQRIEQDVLAHNPAIVLICFGGNDRYYPSKKLSIKQIESNFNEMIRLLDNGKREMYLIRFYNKHMRFLDIFWRFDRMLERIHAAHPNVRIINDIWRGVWGHKEYKYDISHPNGKGNAIIAQTIFNEMKEVLEYNNLVK
jgi:acyl-CoA thioesterase-1